MVGKVLIDASYNKCSLAEKVLGPQPPPWIVKSKIFSRIDALESLAPYLDGSDGPLTIRVLADGKQELNFQPRQIIISQDYLQQKGLLERAILFSKLNTNQPLTSAAVADFLWNFKNGRLAKQSSARPWITELRDIAQYCQSESRLLIHYGFCDTQNELGDSLLIDAEAGPVEWSLQPVLLGVLSDFFISLNLKEQQDFLSRLVFLGEWNEDFSLALEDSRSLEHANQVFMSSAKSWLMPLVLDEAATEGLLQQHIDWPDHNVTIVAVGRSSRDHFEINQPIPGETQDLLVFLSGSEQMFGSSSVVWRFDRQEASTQIGADAVVYLSCIIPEVESLLEYQGVVNKVIYIRYCPDDQINWADVAKNGLQNYLAVNKDIQFVEFNLTALAFAKKVRGPLVKHDDFSAWQRWLMWQKVVSDAPASQEISRPYSVIDGVSRFRF